MKNKIILTALLAFLTLGCSSTRPMIGTAIRSAGADLAVFPAYSGPKARIAMPPFEIKTAKIDTRAAGGLEEILAELLLSSNRFRITQRQPESPADIIISVAVTEFESQSSGGRSGVGGGGGSQSGALGGLLGSPINKAVVGLEVRILNSAAGEPLATTRVQGQASDISAAAPVANWRLPQGLSEYAHTAMEKAIRICAVEAARYIVKSVPENYYKE